METRRSGGGSPTYELGFDLEKVGQMKLSFQNSKTCLTAADGMHHMNLKRGAALNRKAAASRLEEKEKGKAVEGTVCKVPQMHSVNSCTSKPT